MTTTDAKKLTPSQILSISHVAFAQFPSEINEVIAEKVSQMSKAGVGGFSELQITAMNDDVKAAYSAAVSRDEGGDNSNLGLYIGVGAAAAVSIAVAAVVFAKKRSASSSSNANKSPNPATDTTRIIAHSGKVNNELYV